MHANKRKKVEENGWKVGNADDFLGLTPEESAYIEMKLALSHSLKENRRKKDLSQVELAKLIKSSQSRVAKMEAGGPRRFYRFTHAGFTGAWRFFRRSRQSYFVRKTPSGIGSKSG